MLDTLPLHALCITNALECTIFRRNNLHFLQRRLNPSPDQWCRQLLGTGARAPSTSNNFIFGSLWIKSGSQLSKYCVVCEIS